MPPMLNLSSYITRVTAKVDLPDRVQRLIRAREDESERLIGIVQLALVALFGILFFLARRPTDAGMPIFDPVPIALMGYALFIVLRLALASRGILPGLMVVLSILVDISLLMLLIWSFHLQYLQPAAFSLKVPTFIYIFVFVALRALRFDSRYVLITGVAAAVGWMAMVLAAIWIDGSGAITRNFSTYLTSNKILIGAEFDKIFTVLLVTAILALVVRRARAMLIMATREEAAGREIRRFLSGGVADAITKSDQLVEAGTAVERDAAIVMLDIRGFTKLAMTRSPRETVAILTSFHSSIVPLVHSNGGVVDKFLGDGVMITFGAVKPSATAAADALRALDAIMIEAELWQAQIAPEASGLILNVNGAAASGQVVFAALGNSDRLEFTVIGDAVNLAAKLEKHNKVEGSRAIVSGAAFAAAMAQGYQPPLKARKLTARPIGGVPDPMDIVIVAA